MKYNRNLHWRTCTYVCILKENMKRKNCEKTRNVHERGGEEKQREIWRRYKNGIDVVWSKRVMSLKIVYC